MLRLKSTAAKTALATVSPMSLDHPSSGLSDPCHGNPVELSEIIAGNNYTGTSNIVLGPNTSSY